MYQKTYYGSSPLWREEHVTIGPGDESNDQDGGINEERHPRLRKFMIVGTCIALLSLGLHLTTGSTPIASRPSVSTLEAQLETPSFFWLHLHDKERFYNHQTYDHFHPKTKDPKKWSQRYFEDTRFFGGPGNPIIVLMGGEDPVDFVLYPFMSQDVGKRFNAYTMAIEHRFLGKSMPKPIMKLSNSELLRLLSPEQALEDTIQLIKHKQKELGCGPKGAEDYCPVITSGGSYPGFLAFLLRHHYPDVVDMCHASSVPQYAYTHTRDPYAYFDKVTETAEASSPGCAAAVKDALFDVREQFTTTKTHFKHLAPYLGVCPHKIPKYIKSNEVFIQEIIMIVAAHMASNTMSYYPPTPDKDLVIGCKLFQDEVSTSMDKISNFLRMGVSGELYDQCFDMHSELPPCKECTITTADWSGVGPGPAGHAWEFLSCILVPQCSMSEASMFPPKEYKLDWLTEHCETRYGYTPDPNRLNDELNFGDLTNSSRIIFTSGLNDGWSKYSQTAEIPDNDSIKVINYINGAHHSDLSDYLPSQDTPDVVAGHAAISDIIGEWLAEVKEEQKNLHTGKSKDNEE